MKKINLKFSSMFAVALLTILSLHGSVFAEEITLDAYVMERAQGTLYLPLRNFIPTMYLNSEWRMTSLEVTLGSIDEGSATVSLVQDRIHQINSPVEIFRNDRDSVGMFSPIDGEYLRRTDLFVESEGSFEVSRISAVLER